MSLLNFLKQQMAESPKGIEIGKWLLAKGFREHLDDPIAIIRAYGIQALFTEHEKYIYPSDTIAGSIRGLISQNITPDEASHAAELVNSFGQRYFTTNSDHFAPDYETFLSDGISGVRTRIAESMIAHQNDPDSEKKHTFLKAADISMAALGRMLEQYGDKAAELAHAAKNNEQHRRMVEVADTCRVVAAAPPKTFRQALQLVWMVHVSFAYEGRYAMALGRLDQYLYPFYIRDKAAGILTDEQALEWLSCALYKIAERRYLGGDDVVNIAIGGVKPDGSDAVNELSYLILYAVRDCNVPGPNLSARWHSSIPEKFLDECLQVIGTGLGYPALMNDDVNIPALHRHGYSLEDCRNYCMVGCIENFIPGKQPPWSDGRYNVPKFLELALNNGKCMQTNIQMGPDTGSVESMFTMEDFMEAVSRQSEYGAAEYMTFFRNENDRYNRERYVQPYLSCFCSCCIERALDINDGGALYPSVHGAGCMGIGTMADSLAAIEQVVYIEKRVTLAQLREALSVNFQGYDDLRAALLSSPKYGNNDYRADKYAVWYVEYYDKVFQKYRTPDGGPIYIGIASNTQNIGAGKIVAATPDGRLNGMPLSDAASPMHGADKNGPTAVVNSTTLPDYTLVSCGTVLNQKFSPSMFTIPENRARLASLIRTYFRKGGQEIQINAVSREMLMDAMEHPENYCSLVVRVSGFSAFYTYCDLDVQKDILARTEHR